MSMSILIWRGGGGEGEVWMTGGEGQPADGKYAGTIGSVLLGGNNGG